MHSLESYHKFKMFQAMMKFLLIALLAGVVVSDSEMTKQRVNFGAVFRQTSVLDNTGEAWLHSFHVPLPKPTPLRFAPFKCGTNGTICAELLSVHQYLESTLARVEEMYSELITDIDELIPHIPEQFEFDRRALLNFIGGIAKKLFGVSTSEDVQLLAEHIVALKASMGGMAKGIQRHHSTMSSYMNLTGSRFSNLHTEVTGLQVALGNLSDSIAATWRGAEDATVSVTTLLGNTTTVVMEQLQDLDAYSRAIFSTVGGQLSPLLLKPSDLKLALIHIDMMLSQEFPHFILAQSEVNYYYREKSAFSVFKSQDSLHILLHLPITSTTTLFDVYQLDTFPVFYQKGSQDATMLDEVPHYLAVARDIATYLEIYSKDLSSCPGSEVKTCGLAHSLQLISVPSCSLGLFLDDKDMVNQQCHFKYLPKGLKTAVLELEPGLVHLSNVSKVEVRCGEVIKRLEPCLQCVVRVPCDCRLETDVYRMPDHMTSCVDDQQTTVLHPTNLAILMKFLSKDAALLQGSTLLEKALNTSFPMMKISNRTFEQFAEVDHQFQLGLDAVIKKTNQQEEILTTALDPMLRKDKQLQHLATDKDYAILTFRYAAPVLASLALVLAAMYACHIWRLSSLLRTLVMRRF